MVDGFVSFRQHYCSWNRLFELALTKDFERNQLDKFNLRLFTSLNSFIISQKYIDNVHSQLRVANQFSKLSHAFLNYFRLINAFDISRYALLHLKNQFPTAHFNWIDKFPTHFFHLTLSSFNRCSSQPNSLAISSHKPCQVATKHFSNKNQMIYSFFFYICSVTELNCFSFHYHFCNSNLLPQVSGASDWQAHDSLRQFYTIISRKVPSKYRN